MVRWQDIHDLPVAGKHLILDMQTPQLDCEHCGKTFTVHPACVLEGTHVTERLAEALTDCVNVSTLSAASATFHLPESTVRTIFEKIVERRRTAKARSLKPITKLGVDEIHLEVQDGRKKPGSPPGSQLMTEPPPSAESGGKIRRE
jgi:transposase